MCYPHYHLPFSANCLFSLDTVKQCSSELYSVTTSFISCVNIRFLTTDSRPINLNECQAKLVRSLSSEKGHCSTRKYQTSITFPQDITGLSYFSFRLVISKPATCLVRLCVGVTKQCVDIYCRNLDTQQKLVPRFQREQRKFCRCQCLPINWARWALLPACTATYLIDNGGYYPADRRWRPNEIRDLKLAETTFYLLAPRLQDLATFAGVTEKLRRAYLFVTLMNHRFNGLLSHD
jgi:hypothetical protein